jgi:hypothetical protein
MASPMRFHCLVPNAMWEPNRLPSFGEEERRYTAFQ